MTKHKTKYPLGRNMGLHLSVMVLFSLISSKSHLCHKFEMSQIFFCLTQADTGKSNLMLK